MASFNTVLSRIIMLGFLGISLPAYAFSLIEDAIETESLRITLNEDNTGYVQGKTCDYCQLQTIAITPETKVYKKNIEVPLKQAAARIGKPATIFTDIEHTRVTRIVW